MANIRVCDNGIKGPANTPCSTRAPISVCIVGAMPQRKDARTKSAEANMKSRT